MTKTELKKLKKGKKVYCVGVDDYCDCPNCDGSCNEPYLWEGKVDEIDLEFEAVYLDITGGYICAFDRENVFITKREATKELNRLQLEFT